jgi:hypothetical protein
VSLLATSASIAAAKASALLSPKIKASRRNLDSIDRRDASPESPDDRCRVAAFKDGLRWRRM